MVDPQPGAQLSGSTGFSICSQPSSGARPWWAASATVLIACLLVAGRMRASRAGFGVAIVAGGILAIVVGALELGYLYRRRIVVDDVSVKLINLFGLATVVPRANVTRLVVRVASVPKGMEDRLFLVGGDGRCVAVVKRFGLSDQDTARLAAALGIPIDRSAVWPKAFQELESEIPGSTSWPERHRTGFVLLIVALVMMIPLALVAILTMPGGKFA